MPKVCEPCGFYSADNTPTACPTCGQPVKFTLLPPRGEAAAPLAGAGPDPGSATARARRQKEGFLSGLGIDPRVMGFVAMVLVGLAVFAVRQYQKKEQLEQVRPGMHISEAAKLIDTGKGMNHPRMVRFRDRFAPDDKSSGSIDYEDGGNHLVVYWENGIVTRVENKGTGGVGGGTRRMRTTITSDADDKDAGPAARGARELRSRPAGGIIGPPAGPRPAMPISLLSRRDLLRAAGVGVAASAVPSLARASGDSRQGK